MAKTINIFSRILERLQLRSEGQASSPVEENRIHATAEAVALPEAVVPLEALVPPQAVDPFFLCSGAGNLFAIKTIVDESEAPTREEIIQICTQRAVEGVLFLRKLEEQNFKWHFFNRDGSSAEFCGNAARCAQAFLRQSVGVHEFTHHTQAGKIKTWSEGEKHWVQMPDPKILSDKLTVSVDSQNFLGFWCDTGVPHFVTSQRNYRYDLWKQISQKLRNAPDFTERGANITWIGVPTAGRPLQAVTYERGVEDFTQACGTGAMAAALYLKNKWPQQSVFEIKMPGGILTVKEVAEVWQMTGPFEKIQKSGG
ncbi:MAG: diaminopimelate epimerase [Bdellovibrionales bacterium]